MSEKYESPLNGIALAMSFLLTSMVLYLAPEFIGTQLITRSLGVILGFIGFLGFIVELSKTSLNNEKVKDGIWDIVSGIFLGSLIFLLLLYFSNWIVNLIVLFLMLFGIYGTLRGIFKLIALLDFTKSNIFRKLPLLILNLAIFTLTILQLLQIFKVINE
ncbi:hypothetical protein RKD55_000783 [Rossellomorea marisflavi]|nr:hypothetical protein ASG66_18405 [Bacillus sp. Leaf406]